MVILHDRFAPEVALHLGNVVLEQRERRGTQTEVAEGGIPTANPQDRAPIGLDLHGQDRCGGNGSVACQGIGDARAETDALGRNRCNRQRLVDVTVVMLTVGEEQPVPAGVLVEPGDTPGAARSGEVRYPEFGFHVRTSSSLDGTSFPRSRFRDVDSRRVPCEVDETAVEGQECIAARRRAEM